MQTKNLLWVGFFAIAMAYLESAVVVYLRRLYGINNLFLQVPPFDPQIASIEVGRELATLIMLLSVGWVAGRRSQSRLGFAIFAFGLWDVFYYIWLRVFIDWPQTLFSTDLLFLIPLPWWGPVLAPVLISILMIVSGVAIVIKEAKGIPVRLLLSDWAILIIGVLFMLYAFMLDALKALPTNVHSLSQLRSSEFNWLVYLIGLGLAALFVFRLAKSAGTINDV